jgi:hypothetical protein
MKTFKRFILATIVLATVFSVRAQFVVDANEVVGKIKVMNAVNNGPQVAGSTQKKGNAQAYKDGGFGYARLHDAPIAWRWAHTVDISCVFPNFDADENDPKSYDFTLTDKLIKDIYSTNTKVFYRLGQSIEHWSKKYGANPPANFEKWARVCEHIIRHYNEGWANGFHYNIEYWEIWNEPDIDTKKPGFDRSKSQMWTGTEEDFHRLYEITANHLNKCFPHLKVGGPALASNLEWADRFLAAMSKRGVEMDFFSFHRYFGKMEKAIKMVDGVTALLKKYGYSNVEMIFNEWNYLANWTDEFIHTIEVINSYKGAAYAAAAMSTFQDSPVHMMMYYDARPGTAFNGLFDLYTSQPRHAYYALYSWKKLRELGTQVKTDVGGLKDFYATAAKGKNGKLALLLTYYTDDRNVVAPKRVTIDFQGFEAKEAISHVLDRFKMHTETPIEIVNSKATIFMEPNSYILIELR